MSNPACLGRLGPRPLEGCVQGLTCFPPVPSEKRVFITLSFITQSGQHLRTLSSQRSSDPGEKEGPESCPVPAPLLLAPPILPRPPGVAVTPQSQGRSNHQSPLEPRREISPALFIHIQVASEVEGKV